ncbi:MAG: hypothetical protein GY820_46530, partial [Gammaproteobacteria bacterium]|nr:hypothetical protein [Gammaproteobacteria bacterium]
GNKQQNQHKSRKLQQDFCVQASHSNRPNNNSANTPNLEQRLPNSHFRLSYDEGNVPSENRKKCAHTQNQHQTMGDQLNYLPKNCEEEKNRIQSQIMQTNLVMMQGEHSLPVCVHEPKSECDDCQMQNERQLRNKSVPYTIQQKLDENCCENAANCNKPSSQGNSSNSTANVLAAQQSEGNFCKDHYLSRKVINCCDEQNAQRSVGKETQRADYSLSNVPNKNVYEMVHKFDPETRTIGEIVNDSVQVNIQRLSDCLEKIEERLSISNAKMEKVVTDVRELGEVVDHDIMKHDQEYARFFQQLSEEDKTTDKFKNEMTPSQNCRQFTASEPSCSKDYRQLTPTEKIVDRFKKLNPALNIFKAEKHALRSNTEALVMEPYVEALPIQCVPVPSITVHVEGYPLKVVVDTGAGPSLVVPERIGNMILAKKYATLGEMHQA